MQNINHKLINSDISSAFEISDSIKKSFSKENSHIFKEIFRFIPEKLGLLKKIFDYQFFVKIIHLIFISNILLNLFKIFYLLIIIFCH
jgi:hypothetical protein